MSHDPLNTEKGVEAEQPAAHHKEKIPRKLKVSEEEMDRMQVPLNLRDYCVHYLMELNQCRRDNLYLKSWNCEEQKIAYERCEYREYLRRVRKMEKLRKKIIFQKMMEEHAAKKSDHQE